MQKLSLVLSLALLACIPPPAETVPVAAPATKPLAREIPITKVAGHVVRTSSGEVVVDVPRERQPTLHVHPFGVQLDAPRAPSRPLPDGSVDGSELLGALATTSRRTEMRSSEMVVVLEGRQHPRKDAREIDLTDAIVVSKISTQDWTRAFAEYEKRLVRDLIPTLHSGATTNAAAADAMEHAESPLLDLVRPADAPLLEIVRFWNRKRRYLRPIPEPRGSDEIVAWAREELVELRLENGFEGRAEPTSTERDAYRELFGYAGQQLLVQDESGNVLDVGCDATRELARLYDIYNRRLPIAWVARQRAKECDGR